jgi:UDP-N-acetylglucosamine 4,6-dehydratase
VILVTGAAGSVGSALCARLGKCVATDIDTMDVRFAETVRPVMQQVRPDLVYHLAGAKHAPDGEADPWRVAQVNTEGTWNVLRQAELVGARVVLASTCKACDPETAYGASKLIAERMVLNAGGWVARFYNVPESCGNVFELWRALPEDAPLPVTPCTRYFQPLEAAVGLLLAVRGLPSGRYSVDPGLPRRMADVADEVYPGRAQEEIPPRRGDRVAEPLCAAHERMFFVESGLVRIVSPHDPVPARELVAA